MEPAREEGGLDGDGAAVDIFWLGLIGVINHAGVGLGHRIGGLVEIGPDDFVAHTVMGPGIALPARALAADQCVAEDHR